MASFDTFRPSKSIAPETTTTTTRGKSMLKVTLKFFGDAITFLVPRLTRARSRLSLLLVVRNHNYQRKDRLRTASDTVHNGACGGRKNESNQKDREKLVAWSKTKPRLLRSNKMIEVICNDRLGKKVRVKCNEDDTIGDLKKLIAAQVGTRPEKIR